MGLVWLVLFDLVWFFVSVSVSVINGRPTKRLELARLTCSSSVVAAVAAVPDATAEVAAEVAFEPGQE